MGRCEGGGEMEGRGIVRRGECKEGEIDTVR